MDFGIAGVGGEKVDAGTISYMAPECFEHKCKTEPSIDVWAIGVMFYAMMCGTLPFHDKNEKELIRKIREQKVRFPPDIPITTECKNIIWQMLEKDKTKRLELLKFTDMEYYLWDESTLDEKIQEAKQMHSDKQSKMEEEKESRLQEEFLQKLDIKDDKPKKHVNFMQPPSPNNKKGGIKRKPTKANK